MALSFTVGGVHRAFSPQFANEVAGVLDHAFGAEGEWEGASPLHNGELADTGWSELQRRAIEELGKEMIPNLTALGLEGRAVYLPAQVQTASFPLSSGGPLKCASLPGLRNELVELAERWELPLDDEGLQQLLCVAHDPDDGWVADAPEILTFARLVLAANEAARRGCPLWVVGSTDAIDSSGWPMTEPGRETAAIPSPIVPTLYSEPQTQSRLVLGSNETVREVATRKGLEVCELDFIEVGETRYNLRKPIVGTYVPGDAAPWEFRVRECGEQFFGRGDTIEEAYDDWRDQIHTAFQLLAGKRPFEMSEDETDRWDTLLGLINFDEYRDRTPVILTETGRVSKGPPGRREVTWWPSDRTEKIGLDLVPAHFATYATDRWFEAIVERDRRTWQIRKVRHARPIEPIGPLSEKEHDEFWASMKTIADLSDTTEDWTEP